MARIVKPDKVLLGSLDSDSGLLQFFHRARSLVKSLFADHPAGASHSDLDYQADSRSLSSSIPTPSVTESRPASLCAIPRADGVHKAMQLFRCLRRHLAHRCSCDCKLFGGIFILIGAVNTVKYSRSQLFALRPFQNS